MISAATRLALAPLAVLAPERLTQPLQVLDRPQRAGNPLVVLGPGFPFPRGPIRRRPHLVGGQSLEMLPAAVEHTDVRPEELACRDHHKITAERLNVHRA